MEQNPRVGGLQRVHGALAEVSTARRRVDFRTATRVRLMRRRPLADFVGQGGSELDRSGLVVVH